MTASRNETREPQFATELERELYEALEKAIAYCPMHRDEMEWLRQARAALSRARGDNTP